MADKRDVHYSEMGITSLEMLPAVITGTEQDVVDAAYISREHAEKSKYADNDRTEDSLRHMLLGGLIQLNPEQEETLGRDIASFLIDFREGDAPEDQIDLNNNIYGRRLREMYPDREEFIAKAIEIADAMAEGREAPELDGVALQKSYGSFETPERLAEFEKENKEPVMEKGPDGTWQFTEKARKERESLGLDGGGLMLAPGGSVLTSLGKAGEKTVEGIRDLFHGTPKTFDRFEDETFFKENTDQANFGLGHNLAENPLYAEGYRQRAAANPTMTIDGETINLRDIEDPKEREFLLQQFNLSSSNEKALGKSDLVLPSENSEYIIGMAKFHGLDEDSPIVKKLLEAKQYDIDPGGNLYKVQFDAPEETLLNFNTAISDQPKEVQDALARTEIGALMLKEENERIEKVKELVDQFVAQGYGYEEALEYANSRFSPITGREILAQFDRGLGSDASTRKELMGQGLRGIEWVNKSFGQFQGDKNFVAFTARYLSPTAKALGLTTVALGLTTEEAEAAYIPLKAFAEGSDAAKAFFAKAQKRIDEGADTAPNGELYNEMGVYKSEDGDLKVDVPEIRARDVEAMQAMARFQEDMNFFLKTPTKRRKGFEFPITRYIPENSPIFENFPDLKSAKVKILPRSGENKDAYGSYDPRTQSIEVYAPLGRNVDETDPQYTFEIMNSFNTLIHEFQHHIQDVKKAANTGYNSVRSGVGLKGFEQDYRDALDALDQVKPGEVGYEQFKNRVDQMHNLARDSLRNAQKRKEFDDASFEDQVKIVEESIRNFKANKEDTTDFIESSSFGHGIYIRELGEAEARSSGMKALLPEGEARKAVGVFYPKETERVVLTPEDVDFSDELENTHVLVRHVPSYRMSGYTEKSELEVTQQPKAPASKAKQAAGASAVAGLAAPPSEAFVAGLGFEDATPTPSLFDVGEGAIPNELGITNTFLLDLLIPRTKPYDLVTNAPGIGEGLMAADLIDLGIGDFLRGEGTEAGQRIRNEAKQKGVTTDGP